MRRSCPTAPTARSDGNGSSASSITTARRTGEGGIEAWIRLGLAAGLTRARRDVEHGLSLTLDHFRTRDQQERALEILQFKLDVLWAMLDAMQIAYPFAGDERAA